MSQIPKAENKPQLGADTRTSLSSRPNKSRPSHFLFPFIGIGALWLAGGAVVFIDHSEQSDRNAPIEAAATESKAAATELRAKNEERLKMLARSSEVFKAGEQSRPIPVMAQDETLFKYIQSRSVESARSVPSRPLGVFELPTDLTKTTYSEVSYSPVMIGKNITLAPRYEDKTVPGVRYILTPITKAKDFKPMDVHLISTHELPGTQASVQVNESDDGAYKQYVLQIDSTNTAAPEDARLVAWVEPTVQQG